MKRFYGLTQRDGFYGMEQDIDGSFFWTEPRFCMERQQPFGYLYLKMCYLAATGKLTIEQAGGEWCTTVALQAGWQEVAVALPQAGQAGELINFAVTPSTTAPPDPREFGVRIRSFLAIDAVAEYQRIRRRLDNARENEREFLAGVPVLTTTPTKLRIDLESRCNMLPRCVYCAWDFTKEQEQENQARVPFTPAIFDELGPYYDNAEEVVNCSHGETLLSPYLAAVVERLDRDGKHFEFTTNGILLRESLHELLLEKDIYVYISLDAATADGYARYRSDQFDTITGNIRKLTQAKRARGTVFPRIFVSFILMRSNVAELAEFLALSHELGVDAVLFRTLNEYDNTQGQTLHRAGFDFNYSAERLSRQELGVAKAALAELNQRWGLTLFFLCDTGEAKPVNACYELWQSLYLLDRGYMPCCVGRHPALFKPEDAHLPRRQQIERFLNSPEMQTMRTQLAAGRLPDYCRELDCPLFPRHD